MTGARVYKLFGLTVHSELELPELFPIAADGEPDVNIRVGPVEELAQNSDGLHAVNGGLVLIVPDIGRYRISSGSEIIVDPNGGVPERNVHLYLLGSAFGALLHQRGLLPLHANAVEIDAKAVAFMGASGEGKSTLAAWFHDHGHRIIADDVCVVRFDDNGRPRAAPGLPRLRLWSEVLEATGRDASNYGRSYAGEETYDKFDVPLARHATTTSDMEIAVLYVLVGSDRFDIVPLQGVAAAEVLFANTYRGAYISAAGGEQEHWCACVRLVRSIPVFRMERPRRLDRLDAHCRELLEHLRSLTAREQAVR